MKHKEDTQCVSVGMRHLDARRGSGVDGGCATDGSVHMDLVCRLTLVVWPHE